MGIMLQGVINTLQLEKNSSENDKLNSGLRIDNSYWINKYF